MAGPLDSGTVKGLGRDLSFACSSLPEGSQEHSKFVDAWQTWYATRVGNTTDGALMSLVIARGNWPGDFLDGVVAGVTQAEGWAGPDFWQPYAQPWAPENGPRLVIDPAWVNPDGSDIEVGDPMYGVFNAAALNPQWFTTRYQGGEQVQISWDSGNKIAGDGTGDTSERFGRVDARLYDLLMTRGMDPASYMALQAAAFSSDVIASISATPGNPTGARALTEVAWVIASAQRDARIHNELPWWDKYGHDVLGWTALGLGFLAFLLGPETFPVATGLLVAGMGVVGGANAIWYFREQDYVNGALSLLFVVPIAGQMIRFTTAMIKALRAGESVTVAGMEFRILDGRLTWVNRPFNEPPGVVFNDPVPYGEPLPEHGFLTKDPVADGTINPRTGKLVTDPEAPYGRDPTDNHPFTKSEYEQRYVKPDGSTCYPDNNGAAPGSITPYDDANEFINNYGPRVDRIGEPGGNFMAVEIDGVPASLEERSLPVESLGKPYYQYEFTGDLPQGWRIEVSETAPAFGRSGGATQVQVVNEAGEAVSIQDLLYKGVIRQA